MDILPIEIRAEVKKMGQISILPNLLEVICRTTKMGFAAVASVTENRWVTCAVRDEVNFGLKPGDELKLETTICNEIRQHHKSVVIDQADKDPIYAGHHTLKMYGLQSYISVPIILKDKSFFGTLCAIDPRPARINNPETIGMFHLFAELIAFHFDSLDEQAFTRAQLTEEREISKLREQFIAILGHDLRNPVNAISAGTQWISEQTKENETLQIVSIIQKSAKRVEKLIENMLDFASGRLGKGIVVTIKDNVFIEQHLNEVINESLVSDPEAEICTEFAIAEPVRCDINRLMQLFSNLLINALNYKTPGTPVIVVASSDKNIFELSVVNKGKKIQDEVISHLFEPFCRGAVLPLQQGLGLGLYIASEIAKAHGGTMSVVSDEEQTRFTFTMTY